MMQYTYTYASPLGPLLLAGDGIGLTGLWFQGQKYYAAGLPEGCRERCLPVFDQVRRWLDCYFSGREPDFTPPLHLEGTPFQMAVWKLLLDIPYGKTMTYSAIAQALARQSGRSRMSAQAVGGAVGHNPVSIIVPCHRVVGAQGSLTGYAGGIEKKIGLLRLEGTDMEGLSIPKKGTAL